MKLIAHLKELLSNEAMRFDVIKKELAEIKEKFGDARRTEITYLEDEVKIKDLIKDQLPEKTDMVVFCPLTKIQVDVYKRFLALPDMQLMIRKDEPCDCGRPLAEGTTRQW